MASDVQYQILIKASPTAAWTPNKVFNGSGEADAYALGLKESARYADVRVETILAGSQHRPGITLPDGTRAPHALPARNTTIWATVTVGVMILAMIGMLGYEVYRMLR